MARRADYCKIWLGISGGFNVRRSGLARLDGTGHRALPSAFAICTAEFIIAGLLPAISHDLDVDIPTAGLLISGYALGVAIASPVFALLTGKLP
jgi:MFS family permease